MAEVLIAPINVALGAWARKAEFSCDRAGLLACQDIDAAVTAFMKMAGAPESHYRDLDPKTFIDQARELEGYDEDKMDKLVKIISLIGNTHPWTVVRCAELSDWIDYGSYYELLTRSREPTLQNKGFCKHCGKQVKSGAKFCIFCGSEI